MQKDRKYKFEFLLIDSDMKIEDQNVNQFTFINIGETDVFINNQLYLEHRKLNAQTYSDFKEDIHTGQKTAQSYFIRFVKSGTKKNALQIIQKIEVLD